MKRNPILPEGMKKLQDEYRDLLKVQRPKVVSEVQRAAAMGDRSENAEYIFGKKKLREIDAKLRKLADKMGSSLVIDPEEMDLSVIRFGALVSLIDDKGKEQKIKLVGKDEIDPINGAISLDSPMGKALLGKKADQEIELQTPRGKRKFRIAAFSYEF